MLVRFNLAKHFVRHSIRLEFFPARYLKNSGSWSVCHYWHINQTMDKYFQFIFRHHFKALPLAKQSTDIPGESSELFGDLGLWQNGGQDPRGCSWSGGWGCPFCRLAIIINIDRLTGGTGRTADTTLGSTHCIRQIRLIAWSPSTCPCQHFN